ncbi:hypothetical protein BKA83DRAFT_160250 [Pisolithus microcarpus]|nr:hypothetical protein BKA83DRAFT_160250 [Pisolithus microcarpus]
MRSRTVSCTSPPSSHLSSAAVDNAMPWYVFSCGVKHIIPFTKDRSSFASRSTTYFFRPSSVPSSSPPHLHLTKVSAGKAIRSQYEASVLPITAGARSTSYIFTRGSSCHLFSSLEFIIRGTKTYCWCPAPC